MYFPEIFHVACWQPIDEYYVRNLVCPSWHMIDIWDCFIILGIQPSPPHCKARVPDPHVYVRPAETCEGAEYAG